MTRVYWYNWLVPFALVLSLFSQPAASHAQAQQCDITRCGTPYRIGCNTTSYRRASIRQVASSVVNNTANSVTHSRGTDVSGSGDFRYGIIGGGASARVNLQEADGRETLQRLVENSMTLEGEEREGRQEICFTDSMVSNIAACITQILSLPVCRDGQGNQEAVVFSAAAPPSNSNNFHAEITWNASFRTQNSPPLLSATSLTARNATCQLNGLGQQPSVRMEHGRTYTFSCTRADPSSRVDLSLYLPGLGNQRTSVPPECASFAGVYDRTSRGTLGPDGRALHVSQSGCHVTANMHMQDGSPSDVTYEGVASGSTITGGQVRQGACPSRGSAPNYGSDARWTLSADGSLNIGFTVLPGCGASGTRDVSGFRRR